MTTPPAQPTVLDVAEWSRFEIHVDGRMAGFARYRTKDPRLIVFTHTEIDDAFAGRGPRATRPAGAGSPCARTARSSATSSPATRTTTSTSSPRSCAPGSVSEGAAPARSPRARRRGPGART